MYRTHTCGAPRPSHIGETVTLAGWVDSKRDHGGVNFIDLRDRYGITQIVFPETRAELAEAAHNLRVEDVIQVTGKVVKRAEGTANAKLATGEIEIVASELNVISKADVLPFPLDKSVSN